MKAGDVLAELRAWRDEFARAHAYDVHAMAKTLSELDSAGDRNVVRGEPRRPVAARTPNQTLPPTGAVAPIPAQVAEADSG